MRRKRRYFTTSFVDGLQLENWTIDMLKRYGKRRFGIAGFDISANVHVLYWVDE